MKVIRNMIHIDEELCTGCGQCVPGCAEGALAIVDGKARLVSETYCDGLGACLGHCPTGALAVRQVEVEDFDPEGVRVHLSTQGRDVPDHMPDPAALRLKPEGAGDSGGFDAPGASAAPHVPAEGCPGARLATLAPGAESPCARANVPTELPGGLPGLRTQTPDGASGSRLGHWPVQLRLVPPEAPFLRRAELLLTADCTAVALPDYHRRWVPGRVVLMACPKFDDAEAHVARLAAILAANDSPRVTVLRMEVPCCAGLTRIVLDARDRASSAAAVEIVTVARDGRILNTDFIPAEDDHD